MTTNRSIIMKKTSLFILLTCLFISPELFCKQINDRFSMEFSERFRFISWDNAISLEDTAHSATTFTRHRTSLKSKWLPSSKIEACLKLTNEFRYYFVPEDKEFSFDELIVDQAYVRLKDPFEYPIALTIGRQNIMLGERFVVMDGNPLDGSRSIYFNAIKFDWVINPKHKITAFYSYQEETDDWLPVIHNQDKKLIEQPEEGICSYYTGKLNKAEIDAYYVRKNLDSNDTTQVQSGINTIGTRFKYPVINNLDYAIEFAHQFGTQNDNNRSAFGGYSYLRFKPTWSKENLYIPYSLTSGVVYLSGDDPKTRQLEGWDPVFARWPKWSESYIYTQINEDKVAYWTNLFSFYSEVQFRFASDVDLYIGYHHLTAPYRPDDESDFPGGNGRTRGDLFIGKLSYKFDKCWSGHVLWESFLPGDYYFRSADSYTWLRTELMFRY